MQANGPCGRRPDEGDGGDPNVIGVAALYKVLRYAHILSVQDPVEPATLRVMATLAELGPSRASTVAASLNLNLSTISRHLGTLHKQRMIHKSRDPQDGRAYRVELTAHGDETLRLMLVNRAQAIAPVLDTWPPRDRKQLFELLVRLATDLQAHACPDRAIPVPGLPAGRTPNDHNGPTLPEQGGRH